MPDPLDNPDHLLNSTGLYLIWYSLRAEDCHATRAQVRELSDELGLASNVMKRESKQHAFRAAVATTTTYTDPDGATWTLSAAIVRRKNEFQTAEVRRQDGIKIAELKLFASRREREGIVAGSHILKPTVRTTLDDSARAAGHAWVAAALARYEAVKEEAPFYVIGRQVRATLAEVATPIAERDSFFYCYGQHLPTVQAVRVFLRATMTRPVMHIVQVAADAETGILARSADLHMSTRVQAFNAGLEKYAGRTLSRARNLALEERWNLLTTQKEFHEQQLGVRLVQTDSTLNQTQLLMDAIPRPPGLPQVRPR